MLDRVQVRDAEAVADEAPGGAAPPGPDGDAVLAREPIEVPDDQEVGGIAGLGDDGQLFFDPVQVRLVGLSETPCEALLHLLAEVLVGRQAVGDVEGRQERPAKLDLEVAAFGDVQRRSESLGQVREHRGHLASVLQVEVLGPELPALGVLVERARLQAEEHVVRLGVVRFDVVEVVGGAEPELELPGEPDQRLVDLLLFLHPVPLDLEQEAVRPEDVAVGRDGLASAVLLPAGDLGGDLAGQAAGERDQAFRVLGQDLLVDPRLVVHALEVPGAAELEQVQITLAVLRDHRQVVRITVGPPLALEPGAGRHVELAADDRLDPGLQALLVEVDGAVHHAVIGDADRRHPEVGGLAHKAADPARPVEERELGVVVEVDEARWGVRHCFDGSGWRAPRRLV